jgi:hypothetical protein
MMCFVFCSTGTKLKQLMNKYYDSFTRFLYGNSYFFLLLYSNLPFLTFSPTRLRLIIFFAQKNKSRHEKRTTTWTIDSQNSTKNFFHSSQFFSQLYYFSVLLMWFNTRATVAYLKTYFAIYDDEY